RELPSSFTSPLGRAVPINYAADPPEIEIRLQEMFGQTEHPTVGPNRTPLKVTLLSPAHRPVQTTTDLPAFWQSSYADVRKDMRGRYPKHPWPEDPSQADPTLRANLGVGMPLDLMTYAADSFTTGHQHRFEDSDPYFHDVSARWRDALKTALDRLPDYPFTD
ncbi:MAG: ATP-dependent helicase C-terminal domain-containing protein, partial [Pseudomonadota bacterium]